MIVPQRRARQDLFPVRVRQDAAAAGGWYGDQPTESRILVIFDTSPQTPGES